MADSVEVSTIETTDGTIGIIRDNAARQSIANLREGKETVGSVAWENVKGRPTKVSELENDKKYQTDENVSNTLNSTLYAGSSTHGGPATSADKLTTARTISLSGAAAGSGSFDGSANSTINVSSLDATKLTGVVPITNLPPSVVERMSIVKDDTERLALTTDTVQDGDVVKVQSSGLIYYVVDDTKLNEESGYEVFKAGTAASVPWGGVTGKPSSYPPSSHTHTKSQITDFPSSLPNPSNLTMQIEGKNTAVYNGGTSQTFNVTKSSLGLDKVNNTADTDKSVKYAASAGNANTATGHSLGLNIPSPSAVDQDKFLSGKGVWESITGKIEGTKVTAADTADKLATARNITVGSSSKKFDGSSDISYSLSEIGAAPASHNHDDRYEIAYRSNFASNNEYIRLGIATMRQQGDYLFIRVYSGSSYNGHITEDRAFDIHLRTSNGSDATPLYAGYVEYHLNGSSNNDVYIVPNSSGTTYAIWIGLTRYSGNGFYIVEESNGAGWSNSQTTSNSIPSGAIKLTQKNIAYTSDIPTSLPANGGNSSTVNGHTVNADVPSGAKFTDTTYSAASQSANGLMSAADKKAIDREFFRLVPKGGTYIPANADLNSIQYLKVGNYYNPLISESVTMKNIPVGDAFMMYVLAPLSEVYDNESTDQWVYRIRIFITYTGYGIFVQYVVAGATPGQFTYNPWVKMTNSNDLAAVSNKSAKYTLAASNWSGNTAPYTYDLGSTYGANAIIGFDSAVGNTTQLEAARAADIQGSSTTKIYAYGDKPTVDIPIVIIYQ